MSSASAGHDQRVVAKPIRRWHPGDGAQVQLTRVEIEVGDLSQQDADVAVALEDRTEGIGDLAGRQRPGRHLVRERLEEMEVAAVDERDLDRRIPQLRDRLEAAETFADDDDVVAGAGGLRRAVARLAAVTQAHGKSRP
jgi:hypothetical protein